MNTLNYKAPKVLIVNNEDYMRLMIRKIVKDIGYNIVGEATNGRDAIDIYRDKKPDIVILDIALPIMSGYKALKEMTRYYPMPCVIVYSYISDDNTVKTCIEYGAANCIDKRTSITDIKEIIINTWTKFSRIEKLALKRS